MENENEFVKEKTVKMVKINVEKYTDKESTERVKRIVFETDIGNITWKPKFLNETFEKGAYVTSMVQMPYSELPSKVEDIGKEIQKNGSCNVKVDYFIFEKEKDGEIKKYPFITSQKTFDRWEIV